MDVMIDIVNQHTWKAKTMLEDLYFGHFGPGGNYCDTLDSVDCQSQSKGGVELLIGLTEHLRVD